MELVRRHLSYANIAATLALVFAMSGGALAATHYLINSTRQINPKVLNALRAGTWHRTALNGQPIGSAGPTGNAGRGAHGKRGRQRQRRQSRGPGQDGKRRQRRQSRGSGQEGKDGKGELAPPARKAAASAAGRAITSHSKLRTGVGL